MNDIKDLKAVQLDALREVANIGAGHAATALSQMTGSRSDQRAGDQPLVPRGRADAKSASRKADRARAMHRLGTSPAAPPRFPRPRPFSAESC